MTGDDITRVIRRISHEILEMHRGARDLVIVGIHTRGVVLARQLGETISEFEGCDVPIGELDVGRYRDDLDHRTDVPQRQTRIPVDITGMHVIVVDDVLYTGRTIRAGLDALTDIGRALTTELAVLGVVSLMFWALTLIVTLKYVYFLLKADNKGEGGTLALMALAQRALGRRSIWVFLLGVIGTALFYGDGIITPAISVLAAAEGLKSAPGLGPVLSPFILPIAAGILYPLMGVLLSPIFAAAAMSLSSVSVIGNALRLRAVRL